MMHAKSPCDGLCGWRASRTTHVLLVNPRLIRCRQPPLEHCHSRCRCACRRTQRKPRAPSAPDTDDALRHALVRLGDDAGMGQPWARNAGRARSSSYISTRRRAYSVFPTRAPAVHSRAMVRAASTHRYLEHARTRRVDKEDGGVSSCGLLDTSSV